MKDLKTILMRRQHLYRQFLETHNEAFRTLNVRIVAGLNSAEGFDYQQYVKVSGRLSEITNILTVLEDVE